MIHSPFLTSLFIWVGIAFCIIQSAMFSGLNLAIFSVSKLRLWLCENSGARRAGRNIWKKLRIIESNRAARAMCGTLLENYIFHISPMYEFLHSQGWRSKRPGEIAMPSACLACGRIPTSPYPRSSGATLPSTCFSPCCRIPSSLALERLPFRHSSSRSSVRLFPKLIFRDMPSAWRHGSHLC